MRGIEYLSTSCEIISTSFQTHGAVFEHPRVLSKDKTNFSPVLSASTFDMCSAVNSCRLAQWDSGHKHGRVHLVSKLLKTCLALSRIVTHFVESR